MMKASSILFVAFFAAAAATSVQRNTEIAYLA